MQTLKNLFTRKSRIQKLEEEIADMKKRIFKEKNIRNSIFGFNGWLDYIYETSPTVKPLEEDFFDNLEEVENKIDLIAKHLKLEFKTMPSKEETLVVKKIKK